MPGDAQSLANGGDQANLLLFMVFVKFTTSGRDQNVLLFTTTWCNCSRGVQTSKLGLLNL